VPSIRWTPMMLEEHEEEKKWERGDSWRVSGKHVEKGASWRPTFRLRSEVRNF
jgi:hypothetical protein